MVKRKKVSKKRAAPPRQSPIGVRIIAVLVYVMSFLLLISGVGLIFSAGFFLSSDGASTVVNTLIEDFSASTTLATQATETIPYVIGIGGLLALGLSVLFFFTARGLFAGRNWARILTAVLFSLWFIGALADVLRGDIIRNIPELVIDGVVAGYLLFNRKVQAVFVR